MLRLMAADARLAVPMTQPAYTKSHQMSPVYIESWRLFRKMLK